MAHGEEHGREEDLSTERPFSAWPPSRPSSPVLPPVQRGQRACHRSFYQNGVLVQRHGPALVRGRAFKVTTILDTALRLPDFVARQFTAKSPNQLWWPIRRTSRPGADSSTSRL